MPELSEVPGSDFVVPVALKLLRLALNLSAK
jgi:hypothetical protein